MQLPEPPPRRLPGENVIPLINVVFLLLIFFMIAGALEQAELFAVAPPASGTEGQPAGDLPRLLVAEDGRLALDDRPISLDALAGESLGAATAVEVKADRNVAVPRLMEALAALRSAGVTEIQLLTKRDPKRP